MEQKELIERINALEREVARFKCDAINHGWRQCEWWETPYGKTIKSFQGNYCYKLTGVKAVNDIIMARNPEEATSLFFMKHSCTPQEYYVYETGKLHYKQYHFTCRCGKIVFKYERHGVIDETGMDDDDTENVCIDCYNKADKEIQEKIIEKGGT